MKKTYKSLFGQMAYVTIAGLQLLFIPNFMLKTFGFEETNENWIRVFGLLILALNFYYYGIATHGNKGVVMGTVYGRIVFCSGLILFGLLHIMPLPIILFGVMELGLTYWTWREVQAVS
jgi:hypothetical protein